jgi:c(7)-type cytochrome triheme protein
MISEKENDMKRKRFLDRIELKILMWMVFALLFGAFVMVDVTRAEYGDVVINNYSDDAGMRPVVFPHWFHRVRFRCKVCHGGNDINMVKIIEGQYCGACHNGEIAWSVENCNLCHTGVPETPTQVHESTLQKLVAPSDARTSSGK